MCVAVPVRVESIEGDEAVVDLHGTTSTVSIAATPEVKVGDWVLIHAGFCLTVLDEEEAKQTFAVLREAGTPPTE